MSREEELYALTLKDLVKGLAGDDVAAVAAGDALQEPETLGRLVLAALASGQAPGLDNPQVRELAVSLRSQLLPAEANEGDSASEAALAEVTAAVKGLTDAESATLNALGTNLVNSLAQQLLVRLHPLMPAGTPLPPPVKPMELFVGEVTEESEAGWASYGEQAPSLTTSAVEVQAAADEKADPAERKDVDMPIVRPQVVGKAEEEAKEVLTTA